MKTIHTSTGWYAKHEYQPLEISNDALNAFLVEHKNDKTPIFEHREPIGADHNELWWSKHTILPNGKVVPRVPVWMDQYSSSI